MHALLSETVQIELFLPQGRHELHDLSVISSTFIFLQLLIFKEKLKSFPF